MKRVLTAAVVSVGAAGILFAASAAGQANPPAWPAGGAAQVFIWADTVTADTGKQENFFSQGSKVVFRAYAVDLKTKKVITPTQAQYFYVKIPNNPNVRMRYGPVGAGTAKRSIWTGSWSVPSDYKLGLVDFRVLVHTKDRHHGVFQQAPVPAAQLTIVAGRP
jgi:hypothetical protein